MEEKLTLGPRQQFASQALQNHLEALQCNKCQLSPYQGTAVRIIIIEQSLCNRSDPSLSVVKAGYSHWDQNWDQNWDQTFMCVGQSGPLILQKKAKNKLVFFFF